MRRRNLKCNEGISEINNNAVKFSELEIEHVALFSSSSPLIFFHADRTTELAATIITAMIFPGLHTDSTYQSPLRETFVKDIREDSS